MKAPKAGKESARAAKQPLPVSGPGRPLDSGVRHTMEQRFGHDFSHVRVHDGAPRGVSALTQGRDVAFGAGKYDPASERGRRLIAHELAHVVQQSRGVRKEGGGRVDDHLEREADRASDAALAGRHAAITATSAPAVQYKKDDPKVKHTTGKQVDTYLNASTFIKTYIEAKFKKGIKAEGHVHIHTPDEFIKAWVKYALGRRNPDTGKLFTEAEARAWELSTEAFRDGTEIHLHESRGDSTAAIHESIHLFQDDAFSSKVGHNAKEGATEYFTRMICAEQKIKSEDYYSDQHKSIQKLVKLTTKETLAAAYFQGKVDALEKAVEAKGKGTFAKWVGFMNQAKYSDANALL